MPAPCFTGTAGPYSPGELPFLAFHDIISKTTRCQAHVLPLTQMATNLRTIENSLGLPPLTNNDRFAQPMNEYWQ